MFEASAKERQGTQTDIKANLPESKKQQSRDDAANAVKVSARSIQTALHATLPWGITHHTYNRLKKDS